MIFVEECWDLQQQEKEDGVSRVKRIKIKNTKSISTKIPGGVDRFLFSTGFPYWIQVCFFFLNVFVRRNVCWRFRLAVSGDTNDRTVLFVLFFFCCFLLYLGSPKIRFLLKWRMARDRLLFATERLPRLGGADQRKTTANICLRRFRVATFGLGLKKKNKKQITIIIDMIEYDWIEGKRPIDVSLPGKNVCDRFELFSISIFGFVPYLSFGMTHFLKKNPGCSWSWLHYFKTQIKKCPGVS